jgi:hypothetical protein
MMRNIILTGVLVLLACSGGPDPKDKVFDFIDAVKSSDSLRVVNDLDIERYIQSLMMEMSSEDSAKVMADYRLRTISSLLGEGDVRHRWLNSLIVVNKSEVKDSIAEVEVSFIDRESNHQLYTKMQLLRQSDKSWRIIYFK